MSQNISNLPQNMPIYSKNQYIQQQYDPNFSAGNTPISTGSSVAQNNPLIKAASTKQENPVKFVAATAASTAALIGINNYINNPLLKNDYDKTVFKNIENFVDRYASTPKAQNITNFFKRIKTAAKNRINNSEILRTLFRKPSLAGPTAQAQAVGANGHIATRALEVMKKYKEAHPGFTAFDSIIKKAEKESYKYVDEIVNTIKNSGANLKEVMSNRPIWGLGLIKNKSSLQEIINKKTLIDNYKVAGKTLGQKTSGYMMRAVECLTNGMFSGKGAILIQALMIAQSISEASKAEKGEKFSTFMASLTELMAFMATMGIQVRVVNHLAGLKYIGMSPANVEKYRKAIKIANEAAKNGNMHRYQQMTNYIKNLKNAAKANTKWYQKPIKWIGKLVGYGRIKETLKPLKNSKLATSLAKIPYGLKVGLGWAGRVALIMGVVIPIFSGTAKKISYAIFGKPTKTLEREKLKEEQEKQQSQQTNAAPQVNTQNQIQPNNNTTQFQTTQQASQPGNLLNTMNQMKNNTLASQPINQPISASSSLQSPDAGIKRTYIPNPILGPENNINSSTSRSARIDAVLRQADYAEAMAQKYI